MRRTALATLTALALGSSAGAHPHVFIDAGLNLLFDSQGRLAAVRVFWAYDEFYSLLQLEEMRLDRDGDGVLTVEEQKKLSGFDMQWIEGFEGDLFLRHGGKPVSLAQPVEAGAELRDGQIVSWHIRPIVNRIDMDGTTVEAKVYDPGFYTAYTLELGVSVEGRDGCDLGQLPADLAKAYDLVEEMLYGPNSQDFDEDSYPAVGEHFADTITLTCAKQS